MHIEARLFEFLTAFFILSAVVYAVLTAMFANGGVEWAGVTALVMTSGLTLITGTFFRFVARRLDTRPEDYEDAEISDGAGELGFYSPHSWWPVFIALSASVAAVGVALWLPWLIVAGGTFVITTAAGLVFEYYTSPERHRGARPPGPRTPRTGGGGTSVRNPPGPPAKRRPPPGVPRAGSPSFPPPVPTCPP